MRTTVLGRTATIGIAVVLTACGSFATDPPSPSPSTVSSATATRSSTEAPAAAPPSGTPSPSIEASPNVGSVYPYPVGTTVQVVADSVRVRSSAGLDGDAVGLLRRDVQARVVGGPAEADGFTWFEIEHSSGRGWVADGDAEDRWIVAVPGRDASQLALRLRAACDVTPPLISPSFTLTADRRVVIPSPDTGTWLSGRLTEVAFAELAAITIERPELARSADYGLERRPGAPEPPAHGLCVYEFTLGSPDERVRVMSVGWLGDEEETTYYLPGPERRALDDVARLLTSGAALVPEPAWEEPLSEYRAETHVVWLWFEAGSATAGAPQLEDLSVLDGGTTFGEPLPSGRCGYLARAQAEELAAAFAGSRTPLDLGTVGYLTAASESGWVNVVTSPMTPDGFPSCGDFGR